MTDTPKPNQRLLFTQVVRDLSDCDAVVSLSIHPASANETRHVLTVVSAARGLQSSSTEVDANGATRWIAFRSVPSEPRSWSITVFVGHLSFAELRRGRRVFTNGARTSERAELERWANVSTSGDDEN